MPKKALLNAWFRLRRTMTSFPHVNPPPSGGPVMQEVVHSTSVSRSISAFVARHPLLSNCATFGGLYMSAEVSQQFLKHFFTNSAEEGANFEVDWDSVKRYAFLGFVAFPPIVHNWYKWLDGKFPGSGKKIIAKKLLLDQFVLGPPYLALFFVLMSVMEGADDVFEECREKFLGTFAADAAFWIPVQGVNFRFVPAHFRVIFLSSACFVWLNILCAIKSYQSGEPKVKRDGEKVTEISK